jgi:multiple sugar transport system permease protein
MTIKTMSPGGVAPAIDVHGRLRRRARKRREGVTAARRSIVMLLLTLFLLVPILAVVFLSLTPPLSSQGSGVGLASWTYILNQTQIGIWMLNSLWVALLSTAVVIVVAAPAGYVLSRGRGRATHAFSISIFVVQSFPVVIFVIPLFILFSGFGLVDNLFGVMIIYVAQAIAVGCWMLTSYFDTIPIALEEAAWMDGASVVGAFFRVVLRNSLPGVLSTAIYAFLLVWNDYLIAIVFIRSANNFTLPVGIQTFFQQNQTDWGPVMACAVLMLLPPMIVFSLFNRFFSVGGVGGALAGR